jgi:ubiquinone/menaquinone biosynthesis C-methylase UbiE
MFTQSARYYDAIYAAAGKDYQAEAKRLREIISAHKRSPGNALLDVACGTGSHLHFLKDAFQVEGLDLDPAMLQVARRKLPGVALHQGEMAEFDLGRQFDVVACLFSSIGYTGSVAKMDRALANMARHTLPGGLVIVEPWIAPEDFHPGKPHAVFVEEPDRKITRMTVSRIEGRLAILDMHYLVATPAGVEYFVERHELFLFRRAEYLGALDAAGLVVAYDPQGLTGRGLYIGLKPED